MVRPGQAGDGDFGGAHHIYTMAKEHPHAEATYRVVPQKDMTYGVEVAIPGNYPTMVTSFTTVQKAEAWIAQHKRRIAEIGLDGLWRRGPRKSRQATGLVPRQAV